MGRKPITKKRSRNENKREKWIHTCLEYFSEKGIRDVTMDDVATLLGISKATIYNHFKSKDEMVLTGIAMQLQVISGYEEYLNDHSLHFLERYYKSMKFYAESLMTISPILVRDVKEVYPDLWEQVKMFRNQFNFHATKYYEEGIGKGYFFNDINIKVMVASDRWFLEALIESDFLQSSGINLDEAFSAYFRIKFDGIIRSKLVDIPNF